MSPIYTDYRNNDSEHDLGDQFEEWQEFADAGTQAAGRDTGRSARSASRPGKSKRGSSHNGMQRRRNKHWNW